MIVPMDKVSLVVMDKEKTAALEKLRELGVLHLEKKQVQSDTLSRLLEKKTRAENALALLRSAAETLKKQKQKAGAVSPDGTGADVADKTRGVSPVSGDIDAVLALGEERKNLQEQLSSLGREYSRVEKWGDFDPQTFRFLAENGIVLVPYELSLQAWEKLGGEVNRIVLEKNKTGVRLLAVGAEIPGETPFVLPEKSLSEIARRMADIKQELAAIDGKLAGYVPAAAAIGVEREKLLESVEFESARAGMVLLEEDRNEGEDFEGRNVSWLTGYIPREKLGVLKRGASENGWAFIADEPEPDDPVPTLLKNNKLVSLLNPLTDFLEVVPGYNEVDISPWFLLFFVIFFGMIFGDAGYGSILLLAGIIGLVKTIKKGVPGAVKLLCLLGFSNFLWGLLTCSWFGIGIDYLPETLRRISLPLISNVQSSYTWFGADIGALPDFLRPVFTNEPWVSAGTAAEIVQQNLMIFCFTLALFQLSIGHIIAICRTRSLKLLGDIGSIAMLFGMYCIILFLIASNNARQIPLFPPAVHIFGGGFALNFIFANYDGSVGRSILESLKNIISVILGIANVFSDIMSYIRLWAVGLAGAAIAGTVNEMAGGILGGTGPVVVHFVVFVLGTLLLLFGHGLNIVLNALSVLVHGVRLNTLEFSGHVGLTWAGNAYKPFAKRVNKEAQSA
ncbi:MAG: V-type ATP synthase subunit I [Treponema sp.]|jgi:V/A-type H+-transporting ATPase subunit I|nr:V-type ATP synthase subunit I [Treponema sp.]